MNMKTYRVQLAVGNAITGGVGEVDEDGFVGIYVKGQKLIVNTRYIVAMMEVPNDSDS
jgi:hypothetical protein